jgi:hypothetical protein
LGLSAHGATHVGLKADLQEANIVGLKADPQKATIVGLKANRQEKGGSTTALLAPQQLVQLQLETNG